MYQIRLHKDNQRTEGDEGRASRWRTRTSDRMTPENHLQQIHDGDFASCGSCSFDTCCPKIRDLVLSAVRHAQARDKPMTVWDLPNATDLTLKAAYAAVRNLECERLLVIGDWSGHPFDAALALAEPASNTNRHQRAA